MIQIKNVTKLYPAKESGNGAGKDKAVRFTRSTTFHCM